MVTPGENVAFFTTFRMQHPDYFFAIWKVGSRLVVSPTVDFHVVTESGIFILYIPKIEPWMIGEVSCELRHILLRPLFNQFLSTIRTRITNIPRGYNRNRCAATSGRIHTCIYLTPLIPDTDFHGNSLTERNAIRYLYEHPDGLPPNEQQNDVTADPYEPTTPHFELIYCRFPDRHYFFSFKSVNGISGSFTLHHLNESFTCNVNDKTKAPHFVNIKFIWECTKGFPSMNWSFNIELADKNNFFSCLGTTDANHYTIEGVPLEKILKMRIVCVPRGSVEVSENLSISFPSPTIVNPEILPIDAYQTECGPTNLVIGRGAFGIVSVVFGARRTNKDLFAAKFLKMNALKKIRSSRREISYLMTLSHPRIVRLEAAYIGRVTNILLMEYLWGGELYDRIIRCRNYRECDVMTYIRQVLEGLEYLHCNSIAHLDIKPENIICVSYNSVQVKIADFSMARKLDGPVQARGFYGTNLYVPPEVLTGGFLSFGCDMWSLGVMTYVLLSGVIPFRGREWPIMVENIKAVNYHFNYRQFVNTTPESIDFIRKLLLLNSESRLSATQALMHPCLNIHRRQWPMNPPVDEPGRR